MKLRKADEMEQLQNDKSAKNTYLFFSIALLIWSLINFFTTGKTGWEFTILLIGNAIFWGSKMFYRRKMR
jgi:uncharacterized membrane protein YgdD (TMEM256/DUF423 family)